MTRVLGCAVLGIVLLAGGCARSDGQSPARPPVPVAPAGPAAAPSDPELPPPPPEPVNEDALYDKDPPPARAVAADLKALQGEWRAEGSDGDPARAVQYRIVVKDNWAYWYEDDKHFKTTRIDLNPTTEQRRVDFVRVEKGPDGKARETTQRGIYTIVAFLGGLTCGAEGQGRPRYFGRGRLVLNLTRLR